MQQPLAVLVGRFIHHCGALELLTNNAIIQLAEDAILATEATKAPLARRIVTLRRLLLDRTDLVEIEILSLCSTLNSIQEKRNMVAHNPIVSAEPNAQSPEMILVVRHSSTEGPSTREMSREEVADLVLESNELLRRFVELLPSATTNTKIDV